MLRIKSFTTDGLHPPYLLGEEGEVLPPSVREVSRGFRRVTEGVGAESGQDGAESGQEITLAVFVAAATPSDSPSASHLPQEEGLVFATLRVGTVVCGRDARAPRWVALAVLLGFAALTPTYAD
jgi:hypothetical protein